MIFTFYFTFILFWIKFLKFFSFRGHRLLWTGGGAAKQNKSRLDSEKKKCVGGKTSLPTPCIRWGADSGGTACPVPAPCSPCPAPHPTPQHGPVCLCVADSDSQCSPTRQSLSLSEGEEQTDRLQQVELVRTTPMSHWKAGTVQAWLEVVMAMPMYVKACAENVKSGKVGHLPDPRGNAPLHHPILWVRGAG